MNKTHPPGTRAEGPQAPPTIKAPRPARVEPVVAPAPRPTVTPDAEPANRKLIRPQLAQHGRLPRTTGFRRAPAVVPVGVEAQHFHRHAHQGASVVVTLESGEVVRGTLEWYDRDSIHLRRADGPGLLVMKRAIVHACRDEEAPSAPPAPRPRRD